MRYSLQNKILIPFSIIIFLGFTCLLLISYNINDTNTSQIIEKDMIGIRKNLDFYLRQYFLINNLEMNKISLEVEAEKIARELSPQIGSIVEIYGINDIDVGVLRANNPSENEDFRRASMGDTAYAINYLGEEVLVSLSYPLESNGSIIGIVRSTKDYTELYSYNRSFKSIINILVIIIFILVFITALLLSKQLTKPIKQLIKGSEQISEGNFQLDITVKSKDEIGQLAERFQIMAEKIKGQIEIIEKDRDTLREVQAQSKAFFDNVTHELKTPLTTIMGYAQVLQENGFTDRDFFDKGTAYIINESKRLNQLVIAILELSKNKALELPYFFEMLDLKDVIIGTSDEMKIKARRYNIEISCRLQEGLIVNGDRNKLKELLINLLDNAIKYGNVNSTIDVEAWREGNTVLLVVRDTGRGIAEENLNRIFQPFYRVNENNRGERGSAGLGLSIVKDIVEEHGGKIMVHSRLGEGTEVKIELKGEGYDRKSEEKSEKA